MGVLNPSDARGGPVRGGRLLVVVTGKGGALTQNATNMPPCGDVTNDCIIRVIYVQRFLSWLVTPPRI